MSKNAGKSEMAESNKLMRDNIAKLEAIGIPTIEAQKIALTNPELVEPLIAEQMGMSSMMEVTMDPRLQAAQRAALDDITGIAELGLTAPDLAAFAKANREAGGTAMAGIASGEMRLAEKGMLDSGMQIQNIQASAQAAADRQNQANLAQAASAAEARRAALGQQANMASQMSAQDLELKTNKANRADQFASENMGARERINMFNKQYNVDRANQLANLRNQEEVANKGLTQQQFQNKIQKAGGVAQQQANMAGNLQQQAAGAQQAQQAQTGAILNLAGTLGAAGMSKK